MRFSRARRTDLVISMTLAETFLLLLFVVWYGYTAILDPRTEAQRKERLVRLEGENKSLKKELKQANDQIADLNWRLDWWRHTFPGIVEGTSGREARQVACRSNPKCEHNNVLIHASVVRGKVSMVWLTESPKLSKWLADSGRPRPPIGVRITDLRTIETFLAEIRKYYSNAKVNGNECRFDYRLTYESKEDYYDGRELFERYFYPAGLSQAGTRKR